MTLTVAEIAALVGGRLESGNGAAVISGVASLVEAQASDLSFFGNPKYLADLKASKAGAVLIRPGLDFSPEAALITVENPSLAFAVAMEKFRPEKISWPLGIHPSAVIGADCEIAPSASIGACAVLENGVSVGPGSVIGAHSYLGHGTKVGADCLLHPRVTIREHCQLGDRVIIHCGAVIGSDGFGYETVNGRHEKIPQIGIVQIDADVEIGAGTTIDRARFGRTWIGAGTKIDNLVQIAHNVVIGQHSIIVAQTAIAGSSQVGNYVVIAGQCGIAGHLHIGDQAVIGGGSAVTKSVPPKARWTGIYAEPIKDALNKMALTSRLPELFARVKALEARLTGKKEP